MSLKKYLQEKKKAVGEINSIKGLERIIGVLSYCRHAIWGIEDILGQLRDDLGWIKRNGVGICTWEQVNKHVDEAIEVVLGRIVNLGFPRGDNKEYILYTD